MELYFLRHGIAVDPADPRYLARDADRPLTKEGREKLLATGRALRALDLSFDLILSSPSVRARDTAEIIADALGLKRALKLSNAVAPNGRLRDVIDEIRRLRPAPASVLLVGHEPNFSEWVSTLAAGEPGAGVTIKKGGLCKLDVPGTLKPGRCATLEWLLPPKLLTRLK